MNQARTIKVIVDARQAELGAKRYQSAVGGMARAGKTANRSMKGLDTALNSTKKSFSTALSSLNAFSSALLAIGGASLGLNSLLGTLSGFEDTMQTVQSVTNATAQQFELLRNRAKELGGSTRFSATEAAQGFVNLSRAGFKVNESLNAINGTLDLAAASNMSLAQSTDIVSNSIRQFGLSSESTNMVVDTLLATSNRVNTSVAELAAGLEVVGPIANSVGLSIGETSAALGVLADEGIKGSQAGTKLRSAIARLLNPTEQAKAVFEKLGLSARELSPEFNTIQDIFQKLGTSGISVTDTFKVFGDEASGAATILGKTFERMRELNEETSRAAGEAGKAAQAMSQTLGGSLRSLGSAAEALVLNLGDAGLGFALKSVIQTTTQALQILAGMESAVDKNATAARALAEGLQIATAAAIGFGAAKLVTGFVSLSAAIGAATTGTNLLTLAMSVNPIGAVATALGAAAAAAYYYRDSVVKVGGTTATVGDFVVAIWEAISKRISFVGSRLAIAIEGVVMVFDMARKASTSFLDDLNINWRDTLDKVGSALKTSANFILGVFDGVGRSVIGVLQNIANVAVVASEFDFSNPIESAKKLGEALNKAMSPTANFDIVKKQFQESLGKDFVGDVIKVGQNIGKQLSRGIQSSPELKQGLTDLKMLFDPSTIGAEISQSASTRFQERLASVNAAQSDQTSASDPNSQTRAIANDTQSTAARSIQEQERATTQASQSLGNFSQSVDATTSALNQTKNAALDFVGALISQPLQSLFEKSGISKLFGSANGNVFTGGARLMPFANGGVFDQPATFAMADGRTGLAFEAGPEAIMPLARDSQGRLGVRQQGGEGPRTVVNQTYRINVQTPNPDAFRMAPRQIERRARRSGGS